MNQQPSIPELLAPAGSAEALHAAVSSGADAVYLGLGEMNARRGADNFTAETLREACDYAHLRGVSVYLTLNTIVLPKEEKRALALADEAAHAGVDAFIVQDVGLASVLVKSFPEVGLHCSTQMNIHDKAGILAAKSLGAKRVTLARELSLPEVENLAEAAREEGLQVEVFAHGALCVCYSGQCYFSSAVGGRSANRGMCAQACRMSYDLKRKAKEDRDVSTEGEHLLSPRDLSMIDMIPQLVRAGVASLKIEGRMKSSDYVAAVVRSYRRVLDDEAHRATEADRRRLEEAFSRGFTEGYLSGVRGNDLMSYRRPNNRGTAIGRVAEANREGVVIANTRALAEGDVLEIWTNKGNVTSVLANNFEKMGPSRTRLTDAAQLRGVRAGDRVFRVRSAELAFRDDPKEPRVPVLASIRLRIGEAAKLRMSVASPDSLMAGGAVQRRIACALHDAALKQGGDAFAAEVAGEVVEAARTKAVSAEEVREHIGRFGSTPFELAGLEVELDQNVGIGFSALHRLRNEALEALTQAILAPYGEREVGGDAAASLPASNHEGEPLQEGARIAKCEKRGKGARIAKGAKEPKAHTVNNTPLIAALVANPANAFAAKKAGAGLIYVSTQARMEDGFAWSAYPAGCIPALPLVNRGPAAHPNGETAAIGWPDSAEGETECAGMVLAESIGGVFLAREHGAAFEIGPHLPLTNAWSVALAQSWGAKRLWLSSELTLAQIRDLIGDSASSTKEHAPAFGITVAGAQELMVTEHCLLMAEGPCDEACATCKRRRIPHALKDRKGYEFPIRTDAFGRSHLYNAVPLDTSFAIKDLLSAGIGAFLADTTLMTPVEAGKAVKRIRDALERAQAGAEGVAKRPNTTSGHLFRSVA